MVEREREREGGQIKEKACGWQNSEDSLKGWLMFISCVFLIINIGKFWKCKIKGCKCFIGGFVVWLIEKCTLVIHSCYISNFI
jgi:hypothetical protein